MHRPLLAPSLGAIVPGYTSLTVTPGFEDSHFPSDHRAIIVLRASATQIRLFHTLQTAYGHYQLLGLVLLYGSSDMPV